MQKSHSPSPQEGERREETPKNGNIEKKMKKMEHKDNFKEKF